MISPLPSPDECFALLDDSGANEANRSSRLYTGYLGMLNGHNAESLPSLFVDLQAALHAGKQAVALFSYELGAEMHAVEGRPQAFPAAQILLFERCDRLSTRQVEQWLDLHALPGMPAGVAQLRAAVDDQAFTAAIARIHAYIEAGDAYQINYTYRLHFDAYGSPLALYRRLRGRQQVPFGALIALPDGAAVLSLSPELFLHHEDGRITTRPMKGTAAASGDAGQDAERTAALAADPKNRAENLMIVDLLRNDLGRVARIGSVRVPHLFSVDRYNSVLQMTSTVDAELRADAGLSEVFAALYPCGSITGAPKRRAMQIIRELEPDARGLYTGAIGWFAAPPADKQRGDFCLSVPIRTLVLQPPGADGLRRGEMGVGAGIVHDSDVQAELAECRLKSKFLTGLSHDFELFETMQATRDGCRYLDLHLKRLGRSATYFGFPFSEADIRGQLQQAFDAFSGATAYRVRLALKPDGACLIQAAPLAPLDAPVRVLLSSEPVHSGDLFLRHKSSVRARYDAAWRAAEAKGAFDMLFCNERGHLTEGGRSNLFLKLDGRWYTPPLADGVLPGVMRSVLLADPAWNACERSLFIGDLQRAEQIVVCNALRGALSAHLVLD